MFLKVCLKIKNSAKLEFYFYCTVNWSKTTLSIEKNNYELKTFFYNLTGQLSFLKTVAKMPFDYSILQYEIRRTEHEPCAITAAEKWHWTGIHNHASWTKKIRYFRVFFQGWKKTPKHSTFRNRHEFQICIEQGESDVFIILYFLH